MSRNIYVSDMRKLSTVQNGGFPNIFSFHIIHYTLFSSLKNICNEKDFHVAWQTCWWKRPFHVGCQDKSGPGKIHEVILVLTNIRHLKVGDRQGKRKRDLVVRKRQNIFSILFIHTDHWFSNCETNSEAPNDGFVLTALKSLFRLPRVLFDF